MRTRQSFTYQSRLTFAVALFCLLTAFATAQAAAQTLTVLHAFGSQPNDGANPVVGLTMDVQGDLYGTTSSGGNLGVLCNNGCGNVFQLKRAGSGYIYNSLYRFQGGNDGANPEIPVTVGPNGTLYGGTLHGGGSANAGTLFNLKPSPTNCKSTSCPWREVQMVKFNQTNGFYPSGQLLFDGAGNIYGTTWFGGYSDEGTIFQLTPSNGSWAEDILYNFGVGNDMGGAQPYGGVIFDHAGNLYGTTQWGGTSVYGVVYELTPNGNSWTETVLYDFTGGNDGGRPEYNLVMDAAGNLYGTTGWVPETNNPGTVYELTPSGGAWTYHLLYAFPSAAQGAGAVSGLTMDSAGNLYGTTSFEGNQNCTNGCGTVFKLAPSGNGWVYSNLYNFTGGADGSFPFGGVVLDNEGNLYGTAEYGGTGADCLNGEGTCGVVWKLSTH